jgi:hypothetical protein
MKIERMEPAMSNSSAFHIRYIVRDAANQNTQSDDLATTLEDAIASYCPDADLYIDVGSSRIEMDVCQDMYGFHHDLLEIMEAMVADRDSPVGYDDLLPITRPGQRTYGIIVTADPLHLLAFLAQGDWVFMRAENHDKLVSEPLESDATLSSCRRKEVILECCSFLETYLADLVRELPSVHQLEDYPSYLRRLQKVRKQAHAWE